MSNQRKTPIRLLSLVLILALVLSSGAYAFADSSRFEETEHGTTPFAELSYTHPSNQAQFNALKEELLTLCEAGGDPEGALELFEQLYDIYADWILMYNLAMIRSFLDATDKYYLAETEYTTNLVSEYSEELRRAAAAIIDSSYNDYARDYWGQDYYDQIAALYQVSDEELALYEKETALINQYNEASVQEYTIEYDGKEITESDLDALYAGETLSYEDYLPLYIELGAARNAVLGEIFVELLAVRAEIAEYAKDAGYENYLDIQYKDTYFREYSIDEAMALCKSLKEGFVAFSTKASAEIYDLEMLDYIYGEVPFEDTLANVEAYVGKIAPELQESLEYMLEYQQYDFSAGPGKVSMAFTAEPGEIASPFMYHIPYDDYYDISTIVHELGHYNQFYWMPSEKFWPGVFYYDVAEVHSQGLELLFTEYYDEIYPEYGEKPAIQSLYNIVSAVPQTAFGAEFEAYVYSHPGLTLEEINRAAAEIYTSYGFELADPDIMYGWVDITHFFQSPGYYISYATSAITALELWALAQTDREAAVDTYLNTVAMADSPYYEMLAGCGLTIPDAALLEELQGSLESALHILVDTYGHWAEDSIDLLVTWDVVEGVKVGDYYYYQPERSISRAEFVKLLYALMEGENGLDYQKQAVSFGDVAAGDWYAECIAWAVQNGICSGVGEDNFAPKALLSKQDMAVMLMNLSGAYELELEALQGNAEAPDFTDKAAIAGYAAEAVETLQDAGILTGNPDGSFQPESTATRAQSAKVLAGIFGY